MGFVILEQASPNSTESHEILNRHNLSREKNFSAPDTNIGPPQEKKIEVWV
jgi:hypothetical protein